MTKFGVTPPSATERRTLHLLDKKQGVIWRNAEWRSTLAGDRTHRKLLRIENSVSPTNAARSVPFGCVAFSRDSRVARPPPPSSAARRAREAYGTAVDLEELERLQGQLSYPPEQRDARAPPTQHLNYLMAACDQRGQVVAFDFVRNRFWLVARTGVAGTCMAFNALQRRELLVGFSDHSIACFNIETSQLVARLPVYHQSTPFALSTHPSRALAISCAASEAIFWDTERWDRRRVLLGGTRGLLGAQFTPDGDHIITSFADGHLIIWTTLSFNVHWKMSLRDLIPQAVRHPPGPVEAASPTKPAGEASASAATEDAKASPKEATNERAKLTTATVADKPLKSALKSTDPDLILRRSTKSALPKPNDDESDDNDDDDEHQLMDGEGVFAVSSDSQHLVYCGRMPYLQHYSIPEHVHVNTLHVPVLANALVIEATFLAQTTVLVLLTSQGHVHFVDIEAKRLMGSLRGQHFFKRMAASPDGRLLATVLLDQRNSITLMGLSDLFEPEPERRHPAAAAAAAVNTVDPDQLDAALDRVATSQRHTKPVVVVTPTDSLSQMIYRATSTQSSDADAKRRIDAKRIRRFLAFFGEYPSRYRPLIWRFMAQLPENRRAYEALVEMGTHPSYATPVFRKLYPIKSEKLARLTQKLLSALAHWSPLFGELPYLPILVFPLIRLYRGDLISCFELCCTILTNWCHRWFEYFPHPPLGVLDILQDLLNHHDAAVAEHFRSHQVGPQIWAWSLLKTFFSRAFQSQPWHRLMDHLMTHPSPHRLYFITLAYLIAHRATLLKITETDDFTYFFARNNASDLSQILQLAQRLADRCPAYLHPDSILPGFEPLPQGSYPAFNAYPKFIVNYQQKLRQEIEEDETALWQRRHLAEQVKALEAELHRDQRAWERSDWQHPDRMDAWWRHMQQQEDDHAAKQAQWQAAEQNLRAAAMRRVADARHSFLNTARVRVNDPLDTIYTTMREHRVATSPSGRARVAPSSDAPPPPRDAPPDPAQENARHFRELEREWLSRADGLRAGARSFQSLREQQARALERDHVRRGSPSPARGGARAASPDRARVGSTGGGGATGSATVRFDDNDADPSLRSPSLMWSPTLAPMRS